MAQVNWNRQLGLAATLCLIGGAAFWLEYKHKPAKEAEEQQAKNVFHLKDRQIQTINLISPGNSPSNSGDKSPDKLGDKSSNKKEIQFSCLDLSAQMCKAGSNAKWEIQKPMKLKADDSNVNTFVSSLNSLNSENTINLEEETPAKKAALLKEYGLDPQSRKTNRKLSIQTDQSTTVLYLGALHPIGDTTFALLEEIPQGQSSAQLDDSIVYSIPNHLTANFTRDLTSWRNKKLFTLSAHEVANFQVQSSASPIAAERKDGQWTLLSGKEEGSGDTEAINSLLSSAANLSAKDFASDQKGSVQAKNLLKGWSATLILTLEKAAEKPVEKEKGGTLEAAPQKSAPIILTLFEQKQKGRVGGGKVYATVSNLDPLFELDSGAKTRLDKGWKDLRMSRLLTSLERFTAKRLEFSGKSVGSAPIVLVQTEGKWVRESDKTPVSEKKIQETLDRLASTRIRNFLGGSAIPAGAADGVTVTLGDEKNEKKRQILFWKKGEDLYAQDLLAQAKEGLALDPAVKDVIPWTSDYFNPVEPKASPQVSTDASSQPSGTPETAKK